MPAVGWSCLAFANHRLTLAHPFLNVRLLEVGLLLTTRSCSLEADQSSVAWHAEPPGLGGPSLVMGHIQCCINQTPERTPASHPEFIGAFRTEVALD